MDKMKGEYGPVVFSHRTHAQMAEMSGGCYGCHHYNDTALQILSCVTCHPTARRRENVNIPDLKGAYHRQCLDCHRQWSGSPDCQSCHRGSTTGKTRAQILEDASKAKKDHPPVPVPDKKLYLTREQEGTMVTFYHSDHVKRFGLKCTDCHKREGCISCHDKRPEDARKATASGAGDFDARHARCSSCHAEKTCASCHRSSEAPPFDHGRTAGWPLKVYHAVLTCDRCHGAGKTIGKVSGDCTACHKKWESATFNHAVTGLKLDDIHAALDCADCHAERAFAKPPVCVSCHPDKVFPKQKPGKTVSH
jgi:hypothetical protein